jgi:hypothetical protein
MWHATTSQLFGSLLLSDQCYIFVPPLSTDALFQNMIAIASSFYYRMKVPVPASRQRCSLLLSFLCRSWPVDRCESRGSEVGVVHFLRFFDIEEASLQNQDLVACAIFIS